MWQKVSDMVFSFKLGIAQEGLFVTFVVIIIIYLRVKLTWRTILEIVFYYYL